LYIVESDLAPSGRSWGRIKTRHPAAARLGAKAEEVRYKFVFVRIASITLLLRPTEFRANASLRS
jgi:hypothetical protein